jgi:branched-chain amino acid transport system permease protein
VRATDESRPRARRYLAGRLGTGDLVVTTIWAGLSVGALYSFVAIGYTLTYLGSAAFNFAQASFVVVGVYAAYLGLHTFGQPVLAVAVLGAAAVAVLAVIVERIAIAPVRNHEALLVTTVGAATIIDGVLERIAGDQPLAVPFFGSSHALNLAGGRVLPVEVTLIVVVIAIGLTLAIVSHRTLFGMAGLAVSADRDAARLYGIDPRKYAIGTFILAGLLAGAMGVIIGPKTSAYSTLSSGLALKGFVALAFGGFGSFTGATIGGLVCGLDEAFAARYLGPDYQTMAIFVLLVVTLLLFPTGVFGRRQRREV